MGSKKQKFILEQFQYSMNENQLAKVILDHKDANLPYKLLIALSKSNHDLQLLYHPHELVLVPISELKVSGDNIAPNFNEISIEDSGQTLKLGEYEVSTRYLYEEFSEPDESSSEFSFLNFIKDKIITVSQKLNIK